jgi:hypothetical protein
MTVTVRFPDHTVERLTLLQEPEVGAEIDARDGRWLITKMRLPWGLDRPVDVVYDIDVVPAPPIPPSRGS